MTIKTTLFRTFAWILLLGYCAVSLSAEDGDGEPAPMVEFSSEIFAGEHYYSAVVNLNVERFRTLALTSELPTQLDAPAGSRAFFCNRARVDCRLGWSIGLVDPVSQNSKSWVIKNHIMSSSGIGISTSFPIHQNRIDLGQPRETPIEPPLEFIERRKSGSQLRVILIPFSRIDEQDLSRCLLIIIAPTAEEILTHVTPRADSYVKTEPITRLFRDFPIPVETDDDVDESVDKQR